MNEGLCFETALDGRCRLEVARDGGPWRTVFWIGARGADAWALTEDVLVYALAARAEPRTTFGVVEVCRWHPPVELLRAVVCRECGAFKLGPIYVEPSRALAEDTDQNRSVSDRSKPSPAEPEIAGVERAAEPTLLDQDRAAWARALVVIVGRELASW